MKKYIGIGLISIGTITFLVGLFSIVLYVISSGVPIFQGMDSWKDINPALLKMLLINILYVVVGFVLFLIGIKKMEAK